jgi:hypothetical protein
MKRATMEVLRVATTMWPNREFVSSQTKALKSMDAELMQ